MAGSAYDLAIIGGGINGCGIARDAAGRGLSVFLCDQGDLAGATSSASTKLIHGGLRYLEYYEFRLVREALVEREVLLRAAPAHHPAAALRAAAPQGPAAGWLLRLGLFLYDHLGGRQHPAADAVARTSPATPPASRSSRATASPSNIPTAGSTTARLVVLNAIDAPLAGAEHPPAHAVRRRQARRTATWTLNARGRPTGASVDASRARALVNAAGPWVDRRPPQRRPASTRRRRCAWSRAATSSSSGSSITTAPTSSRTPTAASSSPFPMSATSR